MADIILFGGTTEGRELAELLGISKSGLAHRFQKISALAREFEAREKEERK